MVTRAIPAIRRIGHTGDDGRSNQSMITERNARKSEQYTSVVFQARTHSSPDILKSNFKQN